MKDFNFYHITDLHYYANEVIGSYGKHYERACMADEKCTDESGAIVDAAFKAMAEDKDNEVIIISGDLTCNGEKASHDELVKKLQKLKDAGKRIFVTCATHDYDNGARCYTEYGSYKIEEYPREELRNVYWDFGWSEAVSEHLPSLSYAVKMFDGWRFLLLNDDGNGRSFTGYYDDQLKWIRNQVKEANEAGERVIAVTHHPVLPPSKIYPFISHRDMLGGYETTAPMFADIGIEYVFTGHTHNQSITCLDTPRGNRLYHINTGAVCGGEAPYRKVTITDKGLDIKTLNLESFDWDLKGMTVPEYLREHFMFLLNDIFWSMENDIERFKGHAGGFSMEASTVDALRPAIKIVGKTINNLTFKKLAKLFFCSSAVDPGIADASVRDFALDVIFRMFTGKRIYSPDTPEYRAIMPVIRKISKVVKLKDYYGNKVGIDELFEDLFYINGEFDYTDTFLPFMKKN